MIKYWQIYEFYISIVGYLSIFCSKRYIVFCDVVALSWLGAYEGVYLNLIQTGEKISCLKIFIIPIATCSYSVKKDSVIIDGFYVHPHMRRQGYGSLLLEYIKLKYINKTITVNNSLVDPFYIKNKIKIQKEIIN
jgi:GNAT superfamily N-acetyltransferase